jgi:hypothetical protein
VRVQLRNCDWKSRKSSKIFDFNIVGLDDTIGVDVNLKEEMEHNIQKIRNYLNVMEDEILDNYDVKPKRLELIDNIIIEMRKVYLQAKEGRLYRKDYHELKSLFIKTLSGLFGSAETMVDLDYVVSRLQEDEIIAEGSMEEFIMSCPIGRWY